MDIIHLVQHKDIRNLAFFFRESGQIQHRNELAEGLRMHCNVAGVDQTEDW